LFSVLGAQIESSANSRSKSKANRIIHQSQESW
jgi:hypothetical protein